MAAGSSGKVGNAGDQVWKEKIKSEARGIDKWKYLWGEVIDEYTKLREVMKTISEKYLAGLPKIGKQHPHDPRTILPIPETYGHNIGWLANKPEFRMEIYGPDVPNDMPFKELYS